MNIDKLKASEFSQSIYSHEASADLIESIKLNGLLQPIWATEDGLIISGHRRVNACKVLGMIEIPVEIREYSDSLVIEANRYREKTWKEKLREAEELERILKPKAEQNLSLAGERGKPFQKSDKVSNIQPVHVIKEVASSIGTSHDTLHKVKVIAKEKPELLDAVDEGKRSVHSAYNQIQKEKQKEERKNNAPIVMDGKYQVIVVDPPWPIEKVIREERPNQGEFDYPTMSIEQITDLPIEDLLDDNAFLFLWTTHKFLPESFKIVEMWGFHYICTMVWHKTGGFQPFGLPQYNCEFVLLCRKGNISFTETKDFPCCFTGQRREHSRKPSEFYEVIRRVTPDSRIDVFSREKHEGFEQWGNEIGKF